MECNEVRENLSALIDGELPSGQAAQIREHIGSCRECGELLNELDNTDSWLRGCVHESEAVDISRRLVSEADRSVRTGEIRPEGDILTVQDLSRYLKVPIGTVRRLLPEIPCIHIGEHIRFRKESVDAWLSRRESRGSLRSEKGVRLTVVKT